MPPDKLLGSLPLARRSIRTLHHQRLGLPVRNFGRSLLGPNAGLSTGFNVLVCGHAPTWTPDGRLHRPRPPFTMGAPAPRGLHSRLQRRRGSRGRVFRSSIPVGKFNHVVHLEADLTQGCNSPSKDLNGFAGTDQPTFNLHNSVDLPNKVNETGHQSWVRVWLFIYYLDAR